MKLGILYLVPTTLGVDDLLPTSPLEHIIPIEVQRVTATLTSFIAENAKSTRAFLKVLALVYPLSRPLQEIEITELNINTEKRDLPALLAPLLKGIDTGLISEAGVPAVADPGANLVRLAHRQGIIVKPLVGPSSLLLAIMASGLSGQSFAFNGYLPVDSAQRSKRVKELEQRSKLEQQTQLFIETPYRNQAMLDTLATHCHPETLICVATNLTLSDESIKTQTAAQWKQMLNSAKTPDLKRKPTVFLMLAT
jgi:16S rRNA (cytidine1402-2'-O)-methyltransferase